MFESETENWFRVISLIVKMNSEGVSCMENNPFVFYKIKFSQPEKEKRSVSQQSIIFNNNFTN
jgi:hypothetical protein